MQPITKGFRIGHLFMVTTHVLHRKIFSVYDMVMSHNVFKHIIDSNAKTVTVRSNDIISGISYESIIHDDGTVEDKVINHDAKSYTKTIYSNREIKSVESNT